ETLGAASEYVQLLDTEQELTPRQREYIESSRRTISAGLRLIGDLLELARVEAGRLPVQLEPTSVGALLRDMARDYQLASATCRSWSRIPTWSARSWTHSCRTQSGIRRRTARSACVRASSPAVAPAIRDGGCARRSRTRGRVSTARTTSSRRWSA